MGSECHAVPIEICDKLRGRPMFEYLTLAAKRITKAPMRGRDNAHKWLKNEEGFGKALHWTNTIP